MATTPRATLDAGGRIERLFQWPTPPRADCAPTSPAGPTRWTCRVKSPQGVHRVSAADPQACGASSRSRGRDLDVVVASGRIPQDVVFLGLDSGRAAGVHSVGRTGPEKTRETPMRQLREGRFGVPKPLVGGISPGNSQLSSSPLRPAIGAPDVAQLAAAGSPDRGERRSAGDRRGGRSTGESEHPVRPAQKSRSGCFVASGAAGPHRRPGTNKATPPYAARSDE